MSPEYHLTGNLVVKGTENVPSLRPLMPKTVHRSILGELALTFLISVLSLNFFLLTEKILRLSRLLSGVGASVSDMVTLVLLIQPQLMLLTVPMSLLLSTLLTYGRLNTDNEITALRAAGMPFRAISVPVFALGAGCFLITLLISFTLSPSSARLLRESVSTIMMQRAPMAIEAGIFNVSFRDLVVFVRNKPSPDLMEGIFIYDNRNKKEPMVMTAREGRIRNDGGRGLALHLKEGYMHIGKAEGSVEVFFDGYLLSLNLSAEGPSRKNSEMTPGQLLREVPGKDFEEATALYLEFHRRFSLPFICLLLMFLGPPLALIAGKSGRLGGLTIGLGIFIVFYITLVYGENMARSGHVPHYVGAWTPVSILALCSLWAFRKADSR